MLGTAQTEQRKVPDTAHSHCASFAFPCGCCGQFVYTHTGHEGELWDVPSEAPGDPTWRLLVRVLLGLVLSSHLFIPPSTSV